MKRYCTLIVLLCMMLAATGQSIKFTIVDGLQSGPVKQRMENAVMALLSEVNRACPQQRALQLDNIDMLPSAKTQLQKLWAQLNFYCEDNEIMERCIRAADGYSVRNIWIQVNPLVEDYDEERERSLTIRFDRQGYIAGVYIAASDIVYEKIARHGVDVLDLERRETILAFVENYRSHYDEKDTAALNQVFSDDALIITGTVVQRKVYHGDRPTIKSEVIYNQYNKRQYLNKLKGIFNRNKYIKVVFSDIEVKRHPSAPNYYAVTLKQDWSVGNNLKDPNYHDEGYVVLLWEFREDKDPIIHIRTWQPDPVSYRGSDDDLLDIMDFEFPNSN